MPSAALPASPAAAATAITVRLVTGWRSPVASLGGGADPAATYPTRQKTSAYSPA